MTDYSQIKEKRDEQYHEPVITSNLLSPIYTLSYFDVSNDSAAQKLTT